MAQTMRFPLIDLQAQRAVIADNVEAALKRVMEHGRSHMHTTYKTFPIAPDGLPNTMAAKDVIMSLPMHAYLKPEYQDAVIETLLGLV